MFDELRAEIEALQDGAQRAAALNHLAAAEQHVNAARLWVTMAHEQAEREAEAARLAAESPAPEEPVAVGRAER